MITRLTEVLNKEELQGALLARSQTLGFVTAMAAAPITINPNEWIAYLWGGEETSPFKSAEDLEEYMHIIAQIFNEAKSELLEGVWQWPHLCQLDETEIVNENTQAFCEGLLQGWRLARDDWETFFPDGNEDAQLLSGVLLSISMLFDTEHAVKILESEEDINPVEQIEEIYSVMPTMLCGISQKAAMKAEQE